MSVTLEERPGTGTPPSREPSKRQPAAGSRRLAIGLSVLTLLLFLVIASQAGAMVRTGDLLGDHGSLVAAGRQVRVGDDAGARPPARLSLPGRQRHRRRARS